MTVIRVFGRVYLYISAQTWAGIATITPKHDCNKGVWEGLPLHISTDLGRDCHNLPDSSGPYHYCCRLMYNGETKYLITQIQWTCRQVS